MNQGCGGDARAGFTGVFFGGRTAFDVAMGMTAGGAVWRGVAAVVVVVTLGDPTERLEVPTHWPPA